MQHSRVPDLQEFLSDFPKMRLEPICSDTLTLSGQFDFTATFSEVGTVTDSYLLQIDIPVGFPKLVPSVTETGKRIPCHGEFHVNSDRTLCLGSPLRLRQRLARNPTLCGFTGGCLIPYLFAVSHKLVNGGDMVFDELRHGNLGKLDDYAEMFGLSSHQQTVDALRLLGIKKRLANKRPCPCGCGKRLGVCRLQMTLAPFRKLAPCRWFRSEIPQNMIEKRNPPIPKPALREVPLM